MCVASCRRHLTSSSVLSIGFAVLRVILDQSLIWHPFLFCFFFSASVRMSSPWVIDVHFLCSGFTYIWPYTLPTTLIMDPWLYNSATSRRKIVIQLFMFLSPVLFIGFLGCHYFQSFSCHGLINVSIYLGLQKERLFRG
jgi:hypothetical protein